jgi:hypothetical protein
VETEISSAIFSLAATPAPGTPLKILLTSDHQLMPMTAANLQKVEETITQIDGIFFAGDLVNVADRAAEWFDHPQGNAFFPCLQGKAQSELSQNGNTTVYRGGALIQSAPLFTCIGNHEVMGRFSAHQSLKAQFNHSFPRQQAALSYQQISSHLNPEGDPHLAAAWIKSNSFNTDTYSEIFSLPESSTGGKSYYAVTFGDLRLVVLYVTNMWRSPEIAAEIKGRYQERQADLDYPSNWGWGQHIFEPITPDSPQSQWLEAELESDDFREAKYKIVMFHHPAHSLGQNIVPPYTNPIPQVTTDSWGKISSVRYYYPQSEDYLVKYLLPLLESVGVNLVLNGHSHLWNRFLSPQGTHYLETSNVGNSYGAYLGAKTRQIPPELAAHYVTSGDTQGLDPILPNLAPLVENNQPLPYIASNKLTVFSILDTGDGSVTSYYFDTRQPDSAVVKFDQFWLEQG